MRDNGGNLFLKYSDGTNTFWLTWKDYEDIKRGDNTTSISIPSNFTIINVPTLSTQISSTTTSAGASSGGEATLTDTASDFSDVEAGDWVHNSSDSSDGMVLSKTSITALKTALFGGDNDDYTSGDAYVIQPQGRLRLVLDPPPSTASHTVTVEYIQKPAPVYSDYGVYRFQSQYTEALVKYAAWLYKYRDREPNFGDAWFQYWDRQTRRAVENLDTAFNRKGLKVNMKRRQ